MKNAPDSSRRRFLKTSIAAPAILAAAHTQADTGEAPSKTKEAAATLPRRKLGRNGPGVTMLSLGGSMEAHGPQYLDITWSNGIRSFDTSSNYLNGNSEKHIGAWNAQYPERRKDLFLVTKDNCRGGPEDLLTTIDKHLETCKTDYFDLFFLHGIGVKKHGAESLDWPKSDRFKKVVEELKSSGKAKMVGFSCHDDELTTYLNNAAEGGFIDAIMLKYNPFLEKGDALDQALDRLHDAGIGMISMKELRPFSNAPRTSPEMEEIGLTTHQALLHKVWSDKRIAAVCSRMENVNQIEENCAAAHSFKDPLPEKQIDALKQLAAITPVPMCPGCTHCNEAGRHTELAFTDISRYVCYYEQDGDTNARTRYRQLPANSRRIGATDLAALRDGCQYKVDYPEIVRRAEAYFA